MPRYFDRIAGGIDSPRLRLKRGANGANVPINALAPPGPGLRPGKIVVGAVPDLTWVIPRSTIDQTVVELTAAGIKWVRLNLSWNQVEPNAQGTVDAAWLAEVDYAVGKCTAANIQVLMPISDSVPYWASADPNKSTTAGVKSWNVYWKPLSYNTYADFVGRMVTRYRPQGVLAYEIWNEPNLARFWPSGVNAAEYVAMMKAAYPAIKTAAPDATVVMGGLSKSDYTYLEQMYDAGAAPYFDVAAVHPYTGAVDPTLRFTAAGSTRQSIDAFSGLEEVRGVMVARGDERKSLWLTEFGWSTTTATYGVTEAQQADFLDKALVKLGEYTFVGIAFQYNFRNSMGVDTDFEARFGLLRRDFTAKPALASVKAHATAT